jgi:adenylate cyclase
MGTPLFVIGEAYFFKREFDVAVSKLLLAVQDNPGAPPAYRTLAACYAHMGRLDEARTVIAKLCTITTKVLPKKQAMPWRVPEYRELFLSGVRLAAGDSG